MSYRILVIDHDPSGVERIQRPLAEAGYEVVVSSDAAEAMSTFEKVRPDLAVIEALLPEKSGPVLCQEIKDSPAGKATPVVLLLEPDEDKQARARALDLHGCDLLIERTIPEEELVELLEELLRARLAQVGATEDVPKEEEPRAAEPKAAAEGAPGQLIDSNGVVDALSQLDAIIEDRTDSGRAEKAEDDVEQAEAPLDQEKVRRAEKAGDFSFLNENAGGKKPAPAERPGPEAASEEPPARTAEIDQEIVDHIDALFASSEPGGPTLAEKKVLSWTFENADKKSADSSPQPLEPAAEDPEKSSAKPVPAADAKEESPKTIPVAKAEMPVEAKGKTETVEQPASPPQPAATPRTPTPAEQGPVDARQTATFAGTAPRAAKALPQPAEGRHGWWVVAACLAVVLIGGGLAILFLGGDSEPEATGRPAANTAALVTPTAANAAPAPAEEPGEAPLVAVASEGTEPIEPIAGPEPSVPAETAPQAESAPPPAPAEQARVPRTPSSPPAQRTETTSPPARETPKADAGTRSATPAARPRPAEAQVTAPAAEEAAPTPTESSSPAVAPQPEADSPAEAPVTIETVEPETPPAAEAQPVQEASTPAASPVATAAPPPAPAEPQFEPPQLLEGSEPDYPAKSLKRASGERIQLKLLINDKGRISRVLVEHGTRFKDLEAAAVSAVLRWKYRPATENGTAVEAWTTAEFTF